MTDRKEIITIRPTSKNTGLKKKLQQLAEEKNKSLNSILEKQILKLIK